MVLVHEAGHAVSAMYATDGVVQVHVWPGYELYPEFGNPTRGEWPRGSPAVTIVAPRPSASVTHDPASFRVFTTDKNVMYRLQHHLGLISLMGTVATTLVALVALSLISLLRPKGLLMWCLVAGSQLHLDMLTYAFLPTFLGARHLYFLGGELPEPVNALSALGFPEGVSLTAIGLLSLLQWAWLYHLLRVKLRRPVQAS